MTKDAGGPAFTPGLWKAIDYRVFKVVDGLYHSQIAWTAGNAKQRTPQALANARLIAAAPDLYEALKAIIEDHPIAVRALGEVTVRMARAALAKVQS